MKKTSIISLLLGTILCIALFAGCSNGGASAQNTESASAESTAPSASEEATPEATPEEDGQDDSQQSSNETSTGKVKAEITMENGGIIVVELDAEAAPETVENFVKLANEGFYDGLIFHRVIAGFMIQGGDPDGMGTGGPGYGIKGEFASNGWENNISHVRGTLSMARAGDPDSAGSQFFIVHEDSAFLDGDYAAFGMVTEGMDVVDGIASVETDASDKPLEDVVIKSIRIVG